MDFSGESVSTYEKRGRYKEEDQIPTSRTILESKLKYTTIYFSEFLTTYIVAAQVPLEVGEELKRQSWNRIETNRRTNEIRREEGNTTSPRPRYQRAQ